MSHDAPASDARSQARPTRGKYWWLRWVIIAVAAIVLAVELTLVWDQLAKAWKSVYSANWWWVLAGVVAAMSSMHSFAQIQRTLLKSAGVELDRKILADIAVRDAATFASIAEVARSR